MTAFWQSFESLLRLKLNLRKLTSTPPKIEITQDIKQREIFIKVSLKDTLLSTCLMRET